MSSFNRDFKGVWIPKEIWLNSELTLLEKAIFTEIDSLDNENHCIASNDYFAEFCGCSASKVSKAIKKLKDLGMIEVLEFDGRYRKLRVVKSAKQSSKKCYADEQKMSPSNIDSKKENIIKNSKELENFRFGEVKQPKQNLYSKCVSLIAAKTDNEKIRKLLIQWLDMLLEKYRDKGRILYQNVFKGKLNTLDDYDVSEWESVIKYNLQKGYEAFYPVKSYSNKQSNNQLDRPWEQGVSCRKMTEQQEREHENWLNEQRAKGVKVDF